ncbi:hypothetical protein [uncultured Alistipes sp.]|nr:hypothetical protein [uncultured Alistipes sp.]
MVKIIKGSYGHKKGSTIVPVYAGETVELTEEQEARLVNLGVAEYVGKPAQKQNSQNEGGTGDKIPGELPEYNEGMKLAELKEIAAKYGVDASEAKSKKEVIALIEAAQEQPELGGDYTVVDE